MQREASGVKQVFNADQLGELAVLDQDMPENGYFYIYVSNESEKEVNFDNLRISQTSGSFVEENHYYPFGMLIEDLSTDVSKGQKYKYNGKELQTDLNYNVEDYGARHYDPVIARWMHVDPLAEKYRRWSPYNYALDNPVRFIDPDGMQVGIFLTLGAAEYAIPKGVIETATKTTEIAGKTAEATSKTSESSKPSGDDLFKTLTKEETNAAKPKYSSGTETPKDIPKYKTQTSKGMDLPVENLGKAAAAGTAGYYAYDLYQKTKEVVTIPLKIPKEEKKKATEVKPTKK